MSGISIRVEGSELADKTLANAVRRLDDPRDLFESIGEKMVASTQENFNLETDPDGNPWPSSLRVQLVGGKTLTDTGRLAASISYEVIGKAVEIGTDIIYAAIHQFGGVIKAKTAKGLRFRPLGGNQDLVRKSVTMPQRRFLGLGADDANEISYLAGEFIKAAFGGDSYAR